LKRIFIVVLGRAHCGIYKSSYNISNISYLNSLSPLFFFAPLSPIPGVVSTGLYFSIYIYVYTVFALYSPSYTLSPPPPSSHWYQLPSREDLFYPPILWFCKWKKNFFCLFKIPTQGVCWDWFRHSHIAKSWSKTPEEVKKVPLKVFFFCCILLSRKESTTEYAKWKEPELLIMSLSYYFHQSWN
jgi:hypothetical protein